MMDDYYSDGFDGGYGRGRKPGHSYPQTDGDDYSYRRGVEDGRRRRGISDELDDTMNE